MNNEKPNPNPEQPFIPKPRNPLDDQSPEAIEQEVQDVNDAVQAAERDFPEEPEEAPRVAETIVPVAGEDLSVRPVEGTNMEVVSEADKNYFLAHTGNNETAEPPVPEASTEAEAPIEQEESKLGLRAQVARLIGRIAHLGKKD